MRMPKLLLTIAIGGVALGAAMAQYASPHMQFAQERDWRSRLQPAFSSASMQFVDSGPQDPTPAGWVAPDYARAYLPPADEQADAGLGWNEEIDQSSLDASETATVMIEPAPPHVLSDTDKAEIALPSARNDADDSLQ